MVHLTWKNNYKAAADYFDVDFVSNPDLAAQYEYAVPIMIWGMENGIFTGKKLSDYISGERCDYQGARKIINGNDKKELIASYAVKFENILKKVIK